MNRQNKKKMGGQNCKTEQEEFCCNSIHTINHHLIFIPYYYFFHYYHENRHHCYNHNYYQRNEISNSLPLTIQASQPPIIEYGSTHMTENPFVLNNQQRRSRVGEAQVTQQHFNTILNEYSCHQDDDDDDDDLITATTAIIPISHHRCMPSSTLKHKQQQQKVNFEKDTNYNHKNASYIKIRQH